MHTVPSRTDHPHLTAVNDHPGPGDRLLPARLVVTPWFDPGLALRGVDPRSEYVERYLAGIVGPSVVLLVRRLARGLAEHPAGYSLAPADTARATAPPGRRSRGSWWQGTSTCTPWRSISPQPSAR